MIQTTPLNQRDPKWGNVKLGFGEGTIAQYGCVITALTMLLNSKNANLNPLQVNQMMKDKGGFSGNLVWWSKLQQTFPQLTKVGTPVTYDNNAVLALINEGYPVIVNVDGSPIGSPDHWVLFVGDKTLLDPWTGTGKPTTAYKVKKYVAIEVTSLTDPCQQYQTENTILKGKIDELIKENAGLNTKLKVQQTQIDGFQVEMEKQLASASLSCLSSKKDLLNQVDLLLKRLATDLEKNI